MNERELCSERDWREACEKSLAMSSARRGESPHPFPRDFVEAVVFGCVAMILAGAAWVFLVSAWVAS
jgi:hypothetical protein